MKAPIGEFKPVKEQEPMIWVPAEKFFGLIDKYSNSVEKYYELSKKFSDLVDIYAELKAQQNKELDNTVYLTGK